MDRFFNFLNIVVIPSYFIYITYRLHKSFNTIECSLDDSIKKIKDINIHDNRKYTKNNIDSL